MVFHKNYNSLGNLYLNGKVLQYVEQATYLGVSYHKSKLSIKTYFDKVLNKAIQRSAGLRSFGYSADGLRPATGLKLYKMLIRPIFEYATQVIKPPKSFLNGSESCQSQNIKIIFGLEPGTSHACVRLIAGLPPIIARCDYLKTKHYLRILNRTNFTTITNEILNCTDKGFLKDVKDIFMKYNFEFINSQNSKWESQATTLKKKNL